MAADDETPDVPQRRLHRTWPQRLTLVAIVVASLACFASAGALALGQWVVSNRQLTELAEPTSEAGGARSVDMVVPGSTGVPGASLVTTAPATDVAATSELAEPDAANFLVVGADNGDCVGDMVTDEREDLGERSDTIMVWRANPATRQLAVLSFPRDLYVEYPNGGRNRINAAYRRDDPDLLTEVINFNFGVPIDHYIQIDFCAFRRLVEAVGGVGVPFDYPTRDWQGSNRPPSFQIDDTGCINLDGRTALAYVRSRHYQIEDPPGSGNWQEDPTSDFGRIRRQQDFLRRMLVKIIDQGLFDPSVAQGLIETNKRYLVTDDELTAKLMLEFANALRNFDPNSVATYRIESTPDEVDGDKIERPRIRNQNMRAILAVFKGEATLASAPEQVFETTTTLAPPTTTVAGDKSTGDGTTNEGSASDAESNDESSADDSSADVAAAATTLPVVVATENTVGFAPDRSITCD